MLTLITKSIEDTERIANDWLSSVSRKYLSIKTSEALVVGLSGHLGAGKTAFVKAVAKVCGIKEDVTSPTFVIMKTYEINDQSLTMSDGGQVPNNQSAIKFPWNKLIHIDAYRLERREELEVLEWEKLVADKNNLILIEWPENVGLSEFDEMAHIFFQAEKEKRTISM